MAEVDAVGVLEALHELLDRRGLPVVALNVEIHAGAKAIAADDLLDHSNDLGALLVDRRRIEVVDLDIAVGPDRMGQRACILGELMRFQLADIRNALHRARALIS